MTEAVLASSPSQCGIIECMESWTSQIGAKDFIYICYSLSALLLESFVELCQFNKSS